MKFIKITLLKIYWKIFRPKTLGVKLFLINDNKVLLVEHNYLKGFCLPGGGVKTGEKFDQAIKREIFEELGIKIKNLNLFGIYQNTKEGKIDTVITFISTDPVKINEFKINNEINCANFYSIDNLPVNISPGSKKRIEEYQSKNFPTAKKW